MDEEDPHPCWRCIVSVDITELEDITDDRLCKMSIARIEDWICLLRIARVKEQQGDLLGAENLLLVALRIAASAFGENHCYYARTLMHLGDVYIEINKPHEAEETYREALSIYESLESNTDLTTGICLRSIAYALRLQDKQDEYISISLASRSRILSGCRDQIALSTD